MSILTLRYFVSALFYVNVCVCVCIFFPLISFWAWFFPNLCVFFFFRFFFSVSVSNWPVWLILKRVVLKTNDAKICVECVLLLSSFIKSLRVCLSVFVNKSVCLCLCVYLCVYDFSQLFTFYFALSYSLFQTGTGRRRSWNETRRKNTKKWRQKARTTK